MFLLRVLCLKGRKGGGGGGGGGCLAAATILTLPADETEVSVSSPVPFGIPAHSVVTPDIPAHVERKTVGECSFKKKKKKSPILILCWGLSRTLCYTEASV